MAESRDGGRCKLYDDCGREIILTYSLLRGRAQYADEAPETFGISVSSLCGEKEECEKIFDISPDEVFVKSLLNKCMACGVTPVTLHDVICDAIAERTTNCE